MVNISHSRSLHNLYLSSTQPRFCCGTLPSVPPRNDYQEAQVIYCKNTAIERSSAGYDVASKARILSPDEVNQLVHERKVTPINEIKDT